MLDDKENIIDRVRGVYCFKVINTQKQEGMWIIDAKNGKGSITFYGTGITKIEFNIFKLIKWLKCVTIYSKRIKIQNKIITLEIKEPKIFSSKNGFFLKIYSYIM